jgi:hypothetical protein
MKLVPELIVPFSPEDRAAVPAATHVRGTVICSSQRALRARGLFDAYLAQLPAAARGPMAEVSPATWVPIETCVSHYSACDRLRLDAAVVDEIGGEMGRRVNESSLSVLVRMSREAGITPWAAITRVNRFREATWRGGSIAAWKMGPKEARLEWVGIPCARVPYFTFAFAGYVRGILEMFCTKAYVRPNVAQSSAIEVVYRVSWA